MLQSEWQQQPPSTNHTTNPVLLVNNIPALRCLLHSMSRSAHKIPRDLHRDVYVYVTTLHECATISSCLFVSLMLLILFKYKQFITRSIKMRIHFIHSLEVCCWSLKSGHHVKFNPLALKAMTIKDVTFLVPNWLTSW